VYLFLGLSVAVVGSLFGASQLLYYAVGRVLGVERPGGIGGDLLQAAAGPASIVVVYGVAWAYQREAVRRQAAATHEAPRQAGIRRLYTYIVALVGLAVLAGGAAGLLWTLGDVIFNPAALNGDFWRERVALFATLTVVGLPVWLSHWRSRPAAAGEASSLARRLYLYLSLIVAVLVLIGSVAATLYKLIGLALGASWASDVAADLAHAVAVASTAALIAGYHWRALRADARTAQPDVAVSESDVPAPLVVTIQARDGAMLNRALSALRSTGVEVTVMPTQA
jgi:hypothetical protein